jgi:hypothetical protein
LLAVVLCVGACQERDDKQLSSNNKKLDACSLLQAFDAQKILEGEVEKDPPRAGMDRKSSDGSSMSFCSYSLKDQSSFSTVSLLVRSAGKGEVATDRIKQHAESLKNGIGEDLEIQNVRVGSVDGIWVESIGQLTFFIGADMYILSVMGDGIADKKERLQSLAELVYERR